MSFPIQRLAVVWSLFLLGAGAFWAHAAAPAVAPWMEDAARRWKDQPVVRKTLPNGMRLLVVSRAGVPWCGMATVFPGGGASSPPMQSGLAHLAEHLMFEEGGVAGPTSTDVDGESMGLRSNAFTLGDYTVLVEEFSPAVLDGALRIHAARLSRLTFDDVQLAREKKVVADERRFRVDEPPLGHAEELLTSHLWGDHPWGWPVLGWPHHVNRVDRAAVNTWVQRHIRPERGVVVLVGAVDAQRGMAALEKALGPWRASSPSTPPQPVPPPPPPVKPAVPVHATVGAYLWAVEASRLGGPHDATDRVIAALLGRPMHHLVEPTLDEDTTEPLPPASMHAEYTAEVDHGELTVTVDVPEFLTVSDAKAELARVLHTLITRGPAGPELDAARATLVADLDRAASTHAARAEQLAVDEALLGRWDATSERMLAIARVDAAAVRARLVELLSSQRQASLDVLVHPEEP